DDGEAGEHLVVPAPGIGAVDDDAEREQAAGDDGEERGEHQASPSRRRPYSSILRSSVGRLISSSAQARRLFQPVARSARSISRRSRTRSGRMGPSSSLSSAAGAGAAGAPPGSGRSDASSTSLLASTTARVSMFSSSRTLPGQR